VTAVLGIRLGAACVGLCFLVGVAAPASAEVVQLDCRIAVSKSNPVHSKNYEYFVTVDEDAGRAADLFGAYHLWPDIDGVEYAWFAASDNNGPVRQTLYAFNRATLRISAQDLSADQAIDFSDGYCAILSQR